MGGGTVQYEGSIVGASAQCDASRSTSTRTGRIDASRRRTSNRPERAAAVATTQAAIASASMRPEAIATSRPSQRKCSTCPGDSQRRASVHAGTYT